MKSDNTGKPTFDTNRKFIWKQLFLWKNEKLELKKPKQKNLHQLQSANLQLKASVCSKKNNIANHISFRMKSFSVERKPHPAYNITSCFETEVRIQKLPLQENNYEIVVNFFHISRNLT